MKTRIKICGITRVEDALLAEKLGADFIGLILTHHSKRSISADHARDIAGALTTAKPIGVFVEQDFAETINLARHIGLHGVQHYTYFDAGFAPFFYIHAQSIAAEQHPNMGFSSADALLMDTKVGSQHGGTGQTFDWSVLPPVHLSRTIIAGGITPDNIADALRLTPYAVDLSSGIEDSPGIKNAQKLQQLFKEVHHVRNA